MTMPPVTPPKTSLEKLEGEWRIKGKKFSDLAASSQQKIGTFQTLLQQEQKEQAALALKPGHPIKEPLKAAWYVFQRLNLYRLAAERYSYWSAGRLRSGMQAAMPELERNVFYSRLYYEVPAAIAGGGVTSTDALLSMLVPPSSLTPAELDDVRSVVDSMLGSIQLAMRGVEVVDGEVRGEPITLPELVPPKPPAKPTGISRLTIDAIRAALTAPRIPPSVMTTAEYNAMLAKENPNADLGEVALAKVQSDEIIKGWQEYNQQIQAFKEGMAEMPDYRVADFFRDLVTAPALTVLDVAMVYNNNVSAPIAAYVFQTAWMSPEFRKLKDKALAEGLNEWQASGRAWREFDQNWFTKLLQEGATDPLTYVGWNIATKLAKPFGRFGVWVANLEAGTNEILAKPFVEFMALIRRLPRTTTQLALEAARETRSVVRQGTEQISLRGAPKHLYSHHSMSEMERKWRPAIQNWFNHPESTSVANRGAAKFLNHEPIGSEEILSVIKEMGTPTPIQPFSLYKDTADKISLHLVDEVNNTFEEYFAKFMAKAKPYENWDDIMAAFMADLLGGGADPKAFMVVKKWMVKNATAIVEDAMSFLKLKSPLQMMEKLAQRNYDLFLAKEASTAMKASREIGKYAFLFDGLDARTTSIFGKTIEKYLVRAPAQSYLTFGLLGPYNVFEDFVRSILAGVQPGRLSGERLSAALQGLSYDPEFVRLGGISELMGYTARAGIHDPEYANWVLTGMGRVLKPVVAIPAKIVGKEIPTGYEIGEVAYNLMVRQPGEVSMSIRANAIFRKFQQVLASRGEATYNKLVGLVTPPPDILGKRMARGLEADVKVVITSGKPDAIRSVAASYTKTAIHREELVAILDNYTELPPKVKRYILDGNYEGMLDSPENITKRFDEAAGKLVDEWVTGPAYGIKEFQDLTDLLTGKLPGAPPTVMYHGTPLLKWFQQISEKGFTTKRVYLSPSLSDASVWGKNILTVDVSGIKKVYVLDFGDPKAVVGAAPKAAEGTDEWFRYMETWSRKRLDELEAAGYDAVRIIQHSPEDAFIGPPLEQMVVFKPAKLSVKGLGEPAVPGMVNNPEALANLLLSLNYMSSTYGASVRQITALITAQSRGLPLAERRLAMDAGRNGVAEFMEKAGANIDQVNELIGKSLAGSIKSPEHSTAIQRLLDAQAAKRLTADSYRQADMMFRHDTFAAIKSKVELTNSFWENFYRKIDVMDTKFDLEMAKADGVISRLSDEVNKLGGLPAKDIPAVKVIGKLSVNDIARLLGARGDDISRGLLTNMLAINSRPHFIEYVMAKVRPGMDEGFTREGVGKVYDSIAYAAKVSPDAMNWISASQIQLDGARTELHNLYQSRLTSPENLAAIDGYLEGVAKNLDDLVSETTTYTTKKGAVRKATVIRPEFQDWDKVRQESIDEASRWFYGNFVDYTHQNAFDAIIKQVFPFWIYEANRWPYLTKTFMTKPGMLMVNGRYQDSTDRGRVQIPGLDIAVTPLRGTVFGPLSNTNRDMYSNKYDELGPGGDLVGVLDMMQRWGMYPGAHYTTALAIVNTLTGGKAQLGQLIPPAWNTPLMLAQAALPKSVAVKTLTDNIFPDGFRNIITATMVTKNGGNGSLIIAKMYNKEKLTDEEQAQWDNARRWSGLFSAMNEQMGLFTYNPAERTAMYHQAAKVIEEMTGYDEGQQDWLRRHGYRVWDLVGGASPAQTAILQEMDYFKWSGLNTSVIPDRRQRVINQLELDWNDVITYSDSQRVVRLDLQDQFLSATLSPRDYNAKLYELWDDKRKYIDAKILANPNMTLEGRADYYKKFGVAPPVLNYLKEMLNLYYSIELREVTDPDTGEIVTDWDTFYAQRKAIEDSVPDKDKQEFQDALSRNSIYIEDVRRQVYETYFSKYDQVWDAILATYPEDERLLIKEYLYLEKMRLNLTRQEEIKSTVSGKTGNLLISSFRSDVANAKKAFRYANPTLDAWLYFWGRTSSFTTPQAEAIFYQISKDTGKETAGGIKPSR